MNEDCNTDPIADLLSQHALQDLDAESAARLQRLLAEDPALAREAEELRHVVELLPWVTQCAPPAHLRARVLAAAQATAVQPSEPAKVRAIRPKPVAAKRWPLLASLSLATAASLACAVLLTERVDWNTERTVLLDEKSHLLQQNSQLEREVELKTKAASTLLEPNVVLSFPLGGRNPAASASGYVLLDLDARRASIAVRDLPAAPAGYSYHLWAVLESKKVPCGRFTPAADGRILTQFVIPVDSYTSPIQSLILTVEPDREQTTPRGTTVMTS
jgi:hypothetical protein